MNSNEIEAPIVEIGEANFFLEVVKAKQPVLVGFLASGTQPFKVLGAVCDGVATMCGGNVKVVWVNAEDNPNLSRWYRIQSLPTLLYFVDGRPRARVVGTAIREGILSQLAQLTGTV